MIRVAFCDDEPIFGKQMHDCLLRYSMREGTSDAVNIEYLYYSSFRELCEGKMNFDILFLDISLEDGKDGIEEAKKLRQQGMHLPIILLTSLDSRFVDGYEINAFRYLLKPICDERVFAAMDAVLKYLIDTEKTFEISYRGNNDYIKMSQIIFIETYRRKRYVYTNNNKYQTAESWESIKARLPQNQFYMVNRAYIVNLAHIKALSKTEVTMSNNFRVKLSRLDKGMYDTVAMLIKNYVIGVQDENS